MPQIQPSPTALSPEKPGTKARKSGSSRSRSNTANGSRAKAREGDSQEAGEDSKAARVRRVPRQERSRILVDCIRIAASEILKKDGPKALTTNNIAARAGVSIGSLYQYFANKEQILEEVFRERASKNVEDSREWANWLRTLPIRDVIRAMVDRAVTRHREFHSFHPEFYQKHHRNLDPNLSALEEHTGESGTEAVVAWLQEIFELHVEELRVPDARLASVALLHGISATLHGLVDGEHGLLYDENIVNKLTDMTCGLLLRDDQPRAEPVQPSAIQTN
ncbi:MAG: TetR/AcrR family transcriptional regulator [Myxococcota bacterium]|jgi:AcrR family transcriptional regulator|nr:TetR/AcrR family transcriptional regulator [Myxococcota bacterium]